jgi:hypothetical protein
MIVPHYNGFYDKAQWAAGQKTRNYLVFSSYLFLFY